MVDICRQLVKMCELYDSPDVVEYIVPLATSLLTDRVADVRTAALPLVGIPRTEQCTVAED